VDSFVESLTGEEKWINRAYLVFVALDASGNPSPVVPFVPQTEAEKAEWALAEKRRALRLGTTKD
jgi:acyl-CoA hydrolase